MADNRLARSALGTVLALTMGAGIASGYEIIKRMSPEVAAKPIPVVYWVKSGVTAANEARSLARIWEGFRRWEDVPTCGLRFVAEDTIRGGTQPRLDKGKMLVIVGNAADLTSGGATYASETGPGAWVGAVADLIPDLAPVAVHEIGHALGIGHSTIGHRFPTANLPSMHWSVSSPTPLQDDIAAVSLAYPDPVRSLRKETACITGRMMVTAPRPIGIGGMNVVAVDLQGKPVVAALSRYYGLRSGGFELCGIPPGTYDVLFLDGQSYRGLVDVAELGDVRLDAQVDNAPAPAPVRRTVAAGDSVDLGEIPVAIEPVRADSVMAGPLSAASRSKFQPLASPALPDASVGGRYDAWIHLRGGVRRLLIVDASRALAAALPPGIAVKLERDSRTTADAVNGNALLSVSGTPTVGGSFAFKVPLLDKRGVTDTVAFTLRVTGGSGTADGRGPVPADAEDGKEVDALGRRSGGASGPFGSWFGRAFAAPARD